jgi:hypothetical protein|tara:strand:- start:10111 stop:10269 length:159 start_codon:yes stop_codon:yes gene_type:complete
MQFKHPQDTKYFLIGVISSMTAVIVWDIIKNKYKLFNNKPTNKPTDEDTRLL